MVSAHGSLLEVLKEPIMVSGVQGKHSYSLYTIAPVPNFYVFSVYFWGGVYILGEVGI